MLSRTRTDDRHPAQEGIMTKNQLKQRITDISASNLQADWVSDVWSDQSFENLYRFLWGVRVAFELEGSSDQLCHWNIDQYESPSSTLEFLWRRRDDLN